MLRPTGRSLLFSRLKKVLLTRLGRIFTIFYGPTRVSGDYEANNVTVRRAELPNADYKLYEIPEGRLFTDRSHYIAVSRKKSLIPGASWQWKAGRALPATANPALQQGTPRPITRYKGTVLSLLTGGGGNNNYYHWLYDALPRIGLCECAVDLNRIDYLLVPALAYPFQRQTLALLNIEPTRLISSADVRHLTAQRLLVTDHPNPESDNPPPWITHWLRSKFRPEGIVRSDFNTRIYIDRSDSLSKRRVVNEEEILDFLRTEGFSTYRLTELSVAEQVCLFSRAHAVVGVHGAGFANLAFSRPGTKVIELLSTRFMFNTYKQIARANSLNYSSFVSDVVEQNELPYDASFVVPLAEIRRHF